MISRRLLVITVAVVAALVVLAVPAYAVPQQGNSQATPTQSESQTTKPTETPKPKERDPDCFPLEASRTCRAFTGIYVPRNIRGYFKRRLSEYREENVKVLDKDTDLDDLFAKEGYMFEYMNEFMISYAGCKLDNQKWFKTWWCLDLWQHFKENGGDDPKKCATKGPEPKICKSTIKERVDWLRTDLGSSQVCPITQSERDKGNMKANTLENLSYTSDTAPCISGRDNEEDEAARRCGVYSEYAACANEKSCADPVFRAGCEAILSKPPAAKRQLSGCDPNRNDCNPNALKKTPIIIGSVVGAVVLIGLGMLCRTRIKAKNVGDPIKADMQTIARPTGGNAAAASTAPAMAAATAAEGDYMQQQNQKMQHQQQQQYQPHDQNVFNVAQPAYGANGHVAMPAPPTTGSMPPAQPAPAALGGMSMPMASQPITSYGQQMPGSYGDAALGGAAIGAAGGAAGGAAVVAQQGQQGQQGQQPTRAIAQYNFEPTGGLDDELPLREGDVVAVVEAFDDGWAYGVRQAAPGRPEQRGFFPIQYVHQEAGHSAGAPRMNMPGGALGSGHGYGGAGQLETPHAPARATSLGRRHADFV